MFLFADYTLILRIPEGRYEAQWHNYGIRINTLQIHNRFVSLGRSILIHNGNTPKDSEGCMLINDYFMNDIDDIIFQNEQKGKTKEQRLKELLENKLGKNLDKTIKNNVSIYVNNKFKIPILSKKEDREKSIIKNTPAIFNIEGYESGIVGNVKNFLKRNFVTPNIFNEVANNENLISIYAEKYNIDSDLVKAVIFLETTHRYYDRLYDTPFKQSIETLAGEQKSFLPMNINYGYWKELIDKMDYTKEQIKNDPSANLDVGCLLLKRIIVKIQNPTIEKIGTLYNALAKEQISNYGKNLQIYYDDKSWYRILDSINDKLQSTKRF